MAPVDSGIAGDSVPTGTTLTVIIVFLSIALYNVLELSFIIMATFKRRSGLYFWSFIVATWAIPPYSAGFLIKALQVGFPSWIYVTMIVVGWCCMVTGQSVVLYSRLHIVLRDESRLRFVLGMIVFNAVVSHVPIIVMVYGANSANPGPFLAPYSVYEKVQVTFFFVQESIISAMYIRETVALLRARRLGGIDGGIDGGIEGRKNRRSRWLMVHLISVNVIVIALDITILGLEYASLYDLQTAYKGLVYSVKLKLEFSILNRLVEMVQGSSPVSESSNPRTDLGSIRLDAFEGERHTRQRSARGSLATGVSMRSGAVASASSSAAAGVGPSTAAGAKDIKTPACPPVVMTTEVAVRRTRVDLDLDDDTDLESMGGRSGGTEVSTVEGNMGQAGTPSQSSEARIVERRG